RFLSRGPGEDFFTIAAISSGLLAGRRPTSTFLVPPDQRRSVGFPFIRSRSPVPDGTWLPIVVEKSGGLEGHRHRRGEQSCCRHGKNPPAGRERRAVLRGAGG